MKTVREIMEDPKCMWLQVDMGGGGWAPCDAPVVVDDGYMAEGGLVEPGGAVADVVVPLPVPPVVLSLRGVPRELNHRLDTDDIDSDSDVDMGSSPLEARAARRLGKSGVRPTGTGVERRVLFPAVPATPEVGGGYPLRERTIPCSVDGDVSDVDDDISNLGVVGSNDPACGGGSRAGGCECSCGAELGHLSGKVRRLEDMVRLLVASAGLAGWEETRSVENLKRRRGVEREVAERDHVRRVAAEKAAGEEKKKIVRREGLAEKAEEVRKSQ